MQDEKIKDEIDKKSEFNILVSYDREGSSFQSVVERILLRRIEQFWNTFFSAFIYIKAYVNVFL